MIKNVKTDGFTLIESLFIIMIIIVLMYLSMNHPNIHLDDEHQQILKIYELQTNSLSTKKKQEYDEGFTFNSKGDINHAGTIKHDQYEIIFQLGTGRFYIRK